MEAGEVSQLFLIAHNSREIAQLVIALEREGFECRQVPHGEGLTLEITRRRPQLVLLEMNGYASEASMAQLNQASQEDSPPVVGLIAANRLGRLDEIREVDDFITSPYSGRELATRIRRLLARRDEKRQNGRVIEHSGLMIDRDKCEVSVNDRLVELTFKEYELLCFLAAHQGRVYTRQALLDHVWGYEYYGGDRTVDVHVRRLRSKIEDLHNTYIETVRNIGYRFKKNQPRQ
jgi:DNA-binding response OmpR family regulator